MVSASGGRWFEHVGWSTRICCVCVSHGVPAVVGTSMMFLCSRHRSRDEAWDGGWVANAEEVGGRVNLL